MRRNVCLVALALLAAGGLYGQMLETTVDVADSFSAITSPQALGLNPTDNKVYVGGDGDFVVVIDGATNRKAAKVQTEGTAEHFCYNSADNKIYAGCEGTVIVIDGATNQRLATVPVGDGSGTVAYNPVQDVVY